MKKKLCSLFLILLLAAGSTLTAHAEDYIGGNGWYVRFTGEKMESNFKSSDIADAISALQPGDSIAISISLENKDTSATDWYMTNKVLQSLEDSQNVAEGSAYTYVLTYKNSKGEDKTLYSSETVGGETVTGAGEGLHEATDGLEDYFYLDKLDSKAKASISLKVALDGETSGNTYQNTIAKLQMNFAVEKLRGTNTATSSNASRRESNDIYKVGSDVRTGDQNRILLWSLLALLGGIGFMGLAVTGRKGKGGDKHE